MHRALAVSLLVVLSAGMGSYLTSLLDNSVKVEIFADVFEQTQGQVVFVRTFKFKDGMEEQVASGSGFFWKDGLVITASHVVENSELIFLSLASGRTVKATLLGQDAEADVAVLCTGLRNVPHALMGDVRKIKPGHFVVSIGNPSVYRNSLTTGVVSGLKRHIQGTRMLVQSDAAIYYGNSGGPVFDLYGRVVAMTIGMSGPFGMAVPLDKVIYSAEEILRNGKVRYGDLGVDTVELRDMVVGSMAREHNVVWPLPVDKGEYVTGLDPSGPGATSGLKVGDIVLSFNGIRLEGDSVFSEFEAYAPRGVPVSVVVLRNGSEISLTMTPRERLPKKVSIE